MYLKKSFITIILVAITAFAIQAQTTPPQGIPYIIMTVNNGAEVNIRMTSAKDNYKVWIENGKGKYEEVIVGTTLTTITCTAADNIIKVYGNIKSFNCCGNGTDLTGLSFSKGLTNMETLSCYVNRLQSLDVSGLINLTKLNCSDNISLQSLNVSGLKNLKMLFCKGNSLQSLNVSGLTNLTELNCRNNSLQLLNVSGLTNLEALSCEHNSLTKLNVSGLINLTHLFCNNNILQSLNIKGLTNLHQLYCYNNKFTCQTIDDIYCALPDRKDDTYGNIYLLSDVSDANADTVKATNAANAIAKNWKVVYVSDDEIETIGNYKCKCIDRRP